MSEKNADDILPANTLGLLAAHKADIFATFHCIKIGKIEKVTPSEQTAEVSLTMRRAALDGTSTEYPLLVDVPYFVLQGGGAYIDMPITAGDYCLVLFSDRDIDIWWSTANVADPATTRKHDLSDGIAIVGLNPATAPLEMQETAAGINAGDKKLYFKNASQTLAALVVELMDDLLALKTAGSPANHVLDPSSTASFNALKTKFQALLED